MRMLNYRILTIIKSEYAINDLDVIVTGLVCLFTFCMMRQTFRLHVTHSK